MKKVIAIVLIVAVCIVTGVIIQHKKAVTAAPVAVGTSIIHFVPSINQASEPNEQGSCWTGSIAAPFRTDAWRCMTGNQLADPCFEISGTNKLLCSPTGNDSDNFILTLTEALPAPIPASPPIPTNWAWKFLLTNGVVCTPFTGTGTLTADKQEGYYGCSDSTTILGNLDNSMPLWTAKDAILSGATNGLPTVISSKSIAIKAVWQ